MIIVIRTSSTSAATVKKERKKWDFFFFDEPPIIADLVAVVAVVVYRSDRIGLMAVVGCLTVYTYTYLPARGRAHRHQTEAKKGCGRKKKSYLYTPPRDGPGENRWGYRRLYAEKTTVHSPVPTRPTAHAVIDVYILYSTRVCRRRRRLDFRRKTSDKLRMRSRNWE